MTAGGIVALIVVLAILVGTFLLTYRWGYLRGLRNEPLGGVWFFGNAALLIAFFAYRLLYKAGHSRGTARRLSHYGHPQNAGDSPPHCVNGHQAAPGTAVTKFCTVCGARMMVICPNGHEVGAAAHCTVCGLPLPTVAAGAVASAEPIAELAGDQSTPTASSSAAGPFSRNPWLAIGGAVLLVLLIGGGVYASVSGLPGSDGGHQAVATVPAQPAPTEAPTSSPPTSAPTEAPTSSPPTSAPTVTETQTVTSQAAPPSTPSTQPSATPPTTTLRTIDAVNAYFDAINSADYARAWQVGGKNLERGTYDQFVRGFAATAHDFVTIDSVSGDTATVRLDALQTDGTHKYFAGTYTVRDGVIVGAQIRQVGSG